VGARENGGDVDDECAGLDEAPDEGRVDGTDAVEADDEDEMTDEEPICSSSCLSCASWPSLRTNASR
jgi:hypothetical protein